MSHMNSHHSRVRRFPAPLAIVGPALVGAFVLASCGGGETSASRSTINLDADSTAFVVRPPATTIPTDDEVSIDEEGRVEGIQEYTVQPNDYPLLLVDRFGVSLDDLLAVNDWTTADQFPSPGTVIRIPPGAFPVDGVDTQTDAADGGDDADGPADSAGGGDEGASETIPDAGDNCAPGTYTIEAGDYPLVVAEKFDVTVEALNAANSGTQGYDSFYVGLEIVIPAKSDC